MKYYFLFFISCGAAALGMGVHSMAGLSDEVPSLKLGEQSGFEQIVTHDTHIFLNDDTMGQDIVLTEVVPLRGMLPVISFDDPLSD